jgi:membrane protease YdiL (CAAX protease family)
VENNSPSATSQESQTLFPAKAFNPWLTIAVLIAAPLIAFAIIACAGIIAIVSGTVTAAGLQTWLFGLPGVQVQIVAEVAACAFLLAVLPHIARMSFRELGFRPLTLADAGYIALATLVMVVLTNGLASLLETALHTKVSEQAVALYLNMKTPLAKAQFALLGVVVAALFEETIFRIVLFNAVRKWRGFWTGAIVSGLLFGLAHLQSASPTQALVLALPLGLGGVVLCAAYARTGNAYVPIVTHGLFNSVSLVALLFAPQLGK